MESILEIGSIFLWKGGTKDEDFKRDHTSDYF